MLPFLGCAFPASAAAASAPSGSAITLSGSLSATASSSTVTSTARAVTVPAGNSGIIRVDALTQLGNGGDDLEGGNESGGSVQTGGDVTFRIQKNSGVPQAASVGTTVTFANSDTITLSIIGAANVGDGVSVTLVDATTGSIIATYGQPDIYRV